MSRILSNLAVVLCLFSAVAYAQEPLEELPLAAEQYDQLEQEQFHGELIPEDQRKRSAPLQALTTIHISPSDIKILYGAHNLKSEEFTQSVLAEINKTLKSLNIEESGDESGPWLKVNATFTTDKSELHLYVLEPLKMRRQPKRRYRTIVFSASESKGTPDQMIKSVLNKFSQCWKMANTNVRDIGNWRPGWRPNYSGTIPVLSD